MIDNVFLQKRLCIVKRTEQLSCTVNTTEFKLLLPEEFDSVNNSIKGQLPFYRKKHKTNQIYLVSVTCPEYGLIAVLPISKNWMLQKQIWKQERLDPVVVSIIDNDIHQYCVQNTITEPVIDNDLVI